jgi:hypothetical protein
LSLNLGTDRVVLGQLLGHGGGQVRVEALALIDGGQGAEGGVGRITEGFADHPNGRQLGVLLTRDGDVLAARHRQRTRHQAGQTGDQKGLGIGRRAGHTHDDAGRGDDAIVGAEDARP